MNQSPHRSVAPVDRWRLHLLDGSAPVPDRVREALAGGLEVTVPTSVHAALIGAGLIRDITVDGSEADDAWIARQRWAYRTTVTAPAPAPAPAAAGERLRLVFHGIDTLGRVLVNGTERATVADMFRRHELDLTADLAQGPADVVVELAAALAAAERAEAADPLPRPDIYELPYNQVRKMACSFGWDWGPVTVTAGLWRPVELESWVTRLVDVRVDAGWSGGADEPGGARLRIGAAAEGAPGAVAVRVRVTPVDAGGDGEPLFAAELPLVGGSTALDTGLPTALPWQPVGVGAQPRYDVELTLVDGVGRALDTARRRAGFRRVELVQRPDEHGVSCELHVNGVRVWVRGLNWIPDDTFPERITADRLATRIGQAVDAGANLLRVWGGGTYESDDFYDVCDALGVLVWQDFLFACAAYPEDDATVAEVTAEAREAVVRLRHRASLVLWCGCNENLWGHEDWGWKDVLGDRPWGARYYDELLPAVVAELDGTRPYVPGSPFSPAGTLLGDLHPNDDRAGSTHFWETWNRLDYTAFEGYTSRFVAEFGWQAPASWPTLARAIGAGPAAPLLADDDRLAVHQKAGGGRELLRTAVARHLPPATDGPGWYVAAQLVQARAVRTSVPHFRSLHDVCSGTIWWQLNDCWPAVSWSLVDVAGRRKLAWYAVRDAFAPRLAVLGAGEGSGDGGGPVLTLVNDTPDAWTPQVALHAWTPAGAVRELVAPAVPTVPPHGHVVLPVPPPGVDADVVVADVDGVRTARWLRPDLELSPPAPTLTTAVTATGPDAVEVAVTTDVLVRDLCLVAELAVPDAVVDTQLVTLLPGESATFRVTGPDADLLTADRVADLLFHDARLR